MPKFSIKDSIRSGWDTFKGRPWIFVGVVLLVFIISTFLDLGIQTLLGVAQEASGSESWAFAATDMVLSQIIGFIIAAGTLNFYFKAYDGLKEVGIKDLWAPHVIIPFALAGVLSSILILLGFVLLIIPGIFAMLALYFTTYIAVDQKTNAIASLKHSYELTKGNRWRLLGMTLALIGLNILGFLALGIGLLITIPITNLALIHAYRTLLAAKASVATA